MVVTVKFVGSLRTITGKSRFTLKLRKAASLADIIENVAEESPRFKPMLIDVKSSMLILVNGKEISVLNGLETVLKDGDEVVLVPVVHGG